MLRRRKVQPFEAFYVGDVADLGECYCVLSEMYSLPASYFQPALQAFEGHPGVPDDSETYLVAQNNDSRIGRLSDADRALLLDKISGFWTRRIPDA